jgi:arylsulfatase A-like enzyme
MSGKTGSKVKEFFHTGIFLQFTTYSLFKIWIKMIRVKFIFAFLAGLFFIAAISAQDQPISNITLQPNIIMIMADDMGWGDVGFNGNQAIKTPELDRLASKGVILNRFYSAATVCSPTRGSCITGRNPFRYGIYLANVGTLKQEEVSIAEILKQYGYTTGHFGKWHLGSLSDDLPDGRRGGKDKLAFSPPWNHGFDVCFSNEQAVPTWDPMKNQPFSNPTRYWVGYQEFATENLEGDDSRVIMDRVIPFIRSAASNNQPFIALVWFHAPHSPVVAGESFKKMYSEYDENKQHYYGCITAMDMQVGRLYNELEKLGIDKNTLITFNSDNGPAGAGPTSVPESQMPGGRNQGETGGFTGRKGTLYEGGVRVPGFVVWPEKITEGQKIDFPLVTSDFFPTILSILGIELPKRPYDGINIFPALQGKMETRPDYIGFQSHIDASLVSQQYKLLVKNANNINGGKVTRAAAPDKIYELFDLINDKYETNNIAAQHPDIVAQMKKALDEWMESCKQSDNGTDYQD